MANIRNIHTYDDNQYRYYEMDGFIYDANTHRTAFYIVDKTVYHHETQEAIYQISDKFFYAYPAGVTPVLCFD